MPALSPMSSGQKLLAACGIFLFVVGVSTAYSSTRSPGAAPSVDPSQELEQTTLPIVADDTFRVPEVLQQEVQSLDGQDEVAVPVMTGDLLPEQNQAATLPQAQPTSQVLPLTQGDMAAKTTLLLAALKGNGFASREDLAWDRRIFESITPYADVVFMRSYLIFDGTGEQIGRFTYLKAISPEIQDLFAYFRELVERRAEPNVTLSEKTIGRAKVFLYNNLDKTENLRIVVQASAQEVYTLDVPAYMQGIVDAALSAF